MVGAMQVGMTMGRVAWRGVHCQVRACCAWAGIGIHFFFFFFFYFFFLFFSFPTKMQYSLFFFSSPVVYTRIFSFLPLLMEGKEV